MGLVYCGQFNNCRKIYLPQLSKALTTQTRARRTEVPRIKCDDVKHGVCIQRCIGGGCSLKCLTSPRYHSCAQICTGKFQNAFNFEVLLGWGQMPLFT